MGPCWRLVKKSGGTTVVLTDDAINILNRITFYDKDSNQINKNLSEEDNLYYLKEIKKDITYFNRSYKKADIKINISRAKRRSSRYKSKSDIG